MKKSLIEILACPLCKGVLELKIEIDDGDEVIEGSVRCEVCKETYPIKDSIPNLLPSDLRS